MTTTKSDGKIQITKKYYAQNITSANHPNYAIRSVFNGKNMVGIPLRQESYYDGVLQGGSVLEYKDYGSNNSAFLPFKAHSINRDNTLRLNVTVDIYSNGLPVQMTKAGHPLSETYLWDTGKRLSNKTLGQFTWAFTYDGISTLVKQTTDENSFKMVYDYDKLMRLKETKSYFADIPNNTLRSTKTIFYNFGGVEAPPITLYSIA